MSNVTIYGAPQSTYVRSCRMICVEKNIEYDLLPHAPQSPEMLALNPTGQVPALHHDDLLLQEASAIARYLDESFPGAALQPGDVPGRAQMNLWMSVIGDRIYQAMIRDTVLPRLGIIEKSEAEIGEAARVVAKQLQRVDATLQMRPYLAGNDLTLADLFLVPILFWLEMTPEGKVAISSCPALNRWYAKIAERPSFKETAPSMPG